MWINIFCLFLIIRIFIDVNKANAFKAKAKARGLKAKSKTKAKGLKVKAKTKAKGLKAKAKAEGFKAKAKARGLKAKALGHKASSDKAMAKAYVPKNEEDFWTTIMTITPKIE